MRNRALAAGVIAVLSIGATPALGFEETKEAAPEILQLAPEAKDPAMQLQTPATGATQAPEKSGAAKIFGFNILPKLDFGLELLYSERRPLTCSRSRHRKTMKTLPLGKVKRHF
jgi:hypothetical protein